MKEPCGSTKKLINTASLICFFFITLNLKLVNKKVNKKDSFYQ